ncbi:MAG: hypothetical protein ACYS47_11995 [Planctomycetota bacterium]|jgi:hypothetical protein
MLSMIRNRMGLILISAILVVPVRTARGGEKTVHEKLKAYLLSKEDLPEGWELGSFSKDDTQHMLVLMGWQAIRTKYKNFALKPQYVLASGDGIKVYIFTFEDAKAREKIEVLLRTGARGFAFTSILIGEAVVLARSKKPERITQLKEVMAWKYAKSCVKGIRDLARSGKAEAAQQAVDSLVASVPPCPPLWLVLGTLYMEDFDPPRLVRAVELLTHAAEAFEKKEENVEDLWKAVTARAVALTLDGRAEEAQKDVERALSIGARLGLKWKAETHLEVAKAKAMLEDEKGCLEALENGLRSEAFFGSKEIARRAASIPVFASLAKREPFIDLLEAYATAEVTSGFADPDGERIDLSSVPVLVLPPAVRNAGARDVKLEALVEKGLRSKLARQGVFFGEAKAALEEKGWGEFPLRAGREVEKCVRDLGRFALPCPAGDGADLASHLRGLSALAADPEGSSPPPGLVLSVVLVIAPGKEAKKKACVLRAVLFSLSKNRVVLFIASAFESPSWYLKSMARGVATRVMREADAAMKRLPDTR